MTTIVYFFIASVPLIHCEKEEERKAVSPRPPDVKSEAGMARAGKKPIKFAISAMMSPQETFVYYQDLIDYISKKLDRPVDLVQRKTYGEVNDLLREGFLDLALICSGSYVRAREEFEMDILAVPVKKGKSVYYSHIITPKNSNIHSFHDFKGKAFAFMDPLSNTGKFFPSYLLKKNGYTLESFFSKYIYTHSHNRSIELIASGVMDGAAVCSLVWDYMTETNPEITEKTRIIETSPPFGPPRLFPLRI